MEQAKKEKRALMKEVALVFLKLGTFAFGGPAAHIAMMEEEVVRRRKWLSKEAFMDMLGFTNLIPGPNSTEMAIHLGYERAGRAGLFLAGACFILPAAILVGLLAYVYQAFGTIPSVAHVFDGMKPVILAVVLQAIFRLGKTVLKKPDAIILFALTFAGAMLSLPEIPLLLGAGIVLLLTRKLGEARPKSLAVEPITLGALFFVFLRIGAVLYGSGYVLIAFLESELVKNVPALTARQLLDAVAVGQFTPGPVFTTATFVGYIIHGVPGAVLATIGIFLPSFLLVLILRPVMERMRASRTLSHVLDGVNAASLALMAAVTLNLGIQTLVSWPHVLLFAVSAFLLIRFKVSSAYLMLGGAAAGLLMGIIQ